MCTFYPDVYTSLLGQEGFYPPDWCAMPDEGLIMSVVVPLSCLEQALLWKPSDCTSAVHHELEFTHELSYQSGLKI